MISYRLGGQYSIPVRDRDFIPHCNFTEQFCAQ